MSNHVYQPHDHACTLVWTCTVKSSAQRLSDGKKLPTVKMQSRREGKAGANKRVGISEKVMSGVNRGRTINQSKTLFQWLTNGNSLKNSSTN